MLSKNNTVVDILIDWRTGRRVFHKVVFMDENGVYEATPLGIGPKCCTVGLRGGEVRTIQPGQLIGTTV